MNRIEQTIQTATSNALQALFSADVPAESITINDTRKEFTGDLTVVVFPLLRYTKKDPVGSGEAIGAYLKTNIEEVSDFNVVKGFLNISLSQAYWKQRLQYIYEQPLFGHAQSKQEKVMIEYSSPNTNKPLHLGHLRNIILGYALSGLLEADGYEVIKANLINDRGIHICKSMIAWQKFGNGETPESAGLKGDHLVGKYYVEFSSVHKEQTTQRITELCAMHGLDHATIGASKKSLEEKEKGKSISTEEKEALQQIKAIYKEAEQTAPIMMETQEMLRQWEAVDPEVRALWEMMNQWVYDGFKVTYDDLGVSFDKMYYESDTYLLGKAVVKSGLDEGNFFKKEDDSVWVDLTDKGLDEKILLRSDGTSVYITQDIGTADMKYDDYGMERSIYVVGNEQDYHFKVLQEICRKLGRPYADGIYHFSYGMVELTTGKMKSREGTVVDADDLIAEMIDTVRSRTEELGKIEGFSEGEADELYKMIALGALKFFLLKVEPRKGMLFKPEESIDFHGYTGTFVQYNHARIRSVVRKYEQSSSLPDAVPDVSWEALELDLIKSVHRFEKVIADAAEHLNPSAIVDYAYHLAKQFSRYFAEISILGAPDENIIAFRVALSFLVARTIKQAFNIVGIEVPERM